MIARNGATPGSAADIVPQTLHAAVSAVALAHPDKCAVRDVSRTLTYAELDRRAGAIAAHLIDAGVQPGDRVGVYLDRSVDLIAGVLGVLRAGAAYVPLDPEFPAERLALMVEDSGARVVLTESALRTDAPGSTHVLADDPSACAVPAEPAVGAHDAAYVIYTSGSTGRPKGVRIAHSSVLNLLRSMIAEPGIGADDTWLAITTLSFDISVLELFGPLLAAATTVVASREEVLDGAMLRAALERCGATIMQATPISWRMLLEAGWEGDARLKALCGGEALPPDLAAGLASRCGALWNMYGPTETTVWSTCYRVPASGSPILIGRPIASTSVYILDANLRPLPPGVPGEIWIGGAGVAIGYHDRDELTHERFVPDPYSTVAGARMYRTGDHGRYLRDGNIEYRNRVDNQVKIRGFRVELGEIEAALVASGLARQTAVVVRRGAAGDDRLVAFVVAGDRVVTAEAVRAALAERLPGYMIPQHVLELERLPTTPNGKIDRRALEQQIGDLPAAELPFIAPRTPEEQLVAQIFRDVLELERVSADANFFDLGGHSVLAMRVLARLREAGGTLGLRDLFAQPTVAALASRMTLQEKDPADRDDPREVLIF